MLWKSADDVSKVAGLHRVFLQWPHSGGHHRGVYTSLHTSTPPEEWPGRPYCVGFLLPDWGAPHLLAPCCSKTLRKLAEEYHRNIAGSITSS